VPDKYYVDTSIWIDLYEDRKGYNSEPLGYYAAKLFGMIKAKGGKVIVSDYLLRELERHYPLQEINQMLMPFAKNIERIIVTKEMLAEAKDIGKSRNVPKGDAFHAMMAKKHRLVLVTRDNHFRKLSDISDYYRPEDII
jgi:predicted nucleic acid-binding protein